MLNLLHDLRVSREAEIGTDVTIHQNVTIISSTIGNNVMIGANAGILR